MKRKILIIEDDKMINFFLETRLKKEGYDIEITYDGQKALEKTNRSRYDLIITDMMLPSISGLELIAKIKRSSQNFNVPIIVLSSLASPDLIVAALAAGVRDYITKPFSMKVVMARIIQSLNLIPIVNPTINPGSISGKP
jgi:two-component system response regulator VicR